MTLGSGRRGPGAFAWAVLAISLVACLLRAWGLAGAPPLADDLAAGASAVNFVERGGIGPTMWQHPRLRDVLVYASLRAFGASKLGLVLPSLVLGVASVPLLALLGRRLAGPAAGVLAAALLAIDPLHVAYSRQAIQEAHTAFFAVAGVLLVARHVATTGRIPLVAAGVAFGLGVATKWSVAFPLAVALAWAARAAVRDVAPGVGRAERLAVVAAALGVLPIAVYAATWAPWMLTGRGLADLVELHRLLVGEVTTHGGYNPATLEMPHRAALWFLWPIWYADFTVGPEGPLPYVTVTNPAVWLLVLPAAVAAGWEARRSRDAGLTIAAAAFALTWLPFAVASRPIWLHSALPVLPFALVLVAAAAWRVASRTSRPRALAAAYLGLVVLVAVPLYLAATGHAFDVPLLRQLVESVRPAFEAGVRAP